MTFRHGVHQLPVKYALTKALHRESNGEDYEKSWIKGDCTTTSRTARRLDHPRLPAAIHLGLGSPAGRNRPAIPFCAESQLTQGEHEVALVIDLAPTLEERCRMLDHVDEAIADIRRLIAPMKQKRRRRQLRLPFVERRKKSRVLRA